MLTDKRTNISVIDGANSNFIEVMIAPQRTRWAGRMPDNRLSKQLLHTQAHGRYQELRETVQAFQVHHERLSNHENLSPVQGHCSAIKTK